MGRNKKVHYDVYEGVCLGVRESLCGCYHSYGKDEYFTKDPAKVTCKLCKKNLNVPEPKAEIKEETKEDCSCTACNHPDPRVRAIAGNQPVTLENAWVDAEVFDITRGVGKIVKIDKDCHYPIYVEFTTEKITYFVDGKSNFTYNYPNLYWPDGIVQPKPQKFKEGQLVVNKTSENVRLWGGCLLEDYWRLPTEDEMNSFIKKLRGEE